MGNGGGVGNNCYNCYNLKIVSPLIWQAAMRTRLYLTLGMLAGLLGFTISQAILTLPNLTNFLRPEFVLFPITSSLLAVAIVIAEVWLNNPTRYKMNRGILPRPLILALFVGLLGGGIAALLSFLVGYTNFSLSERLVKTLGWMLIGVAAGVADGYSWQHRTIAGGQQQRARQRLITSTVFGAIAGLVAFFASSLVFSLPDWRNWEELVGFLVLGGVLGLLLAKAGSGVLCYALRMGAGFEAERHPNPNTPFPRINSRQLHLNCLSPSAIDEKGRVISGLEFKLEEGMSIELPRRGKIEIGGERDADIFISQLPEECATIILDGRQASIEAHQSNCVSVGKIQLKAGRPESLSHNQVLTLVTDANKTKDQPGMKFVRFIFYDRFLDPQG